MASRTELNDDLTVIKNWALQWSMILVQSLVIQLNNYFVTEVQVRYTICLLFATIALNSDNISKAPSVILDSRLSFNDHLNSVLSKINKAINQ